MNRHSKDEERLNLIKKIVVLFMQRLKSEAIFDGRLVLKKVKRDFGGGYDVDIVHTGYKISEVKGFFKEKERVFEVDFYEHKGVVNLCVECFAFGPDLGGRLLPELFSEFENDIVSMFDKVSCSYFDRDTTEMEQAANSLAHILERRV